MVKVMIVEDDPMVKEINSRFLSRIEGFTLSGTAGSIKEAKQMIMVQKPQVILLDIYLPGENGLDFLKWIRKEGLECDVILITADRSIDAIQQALRYGSVDYLVKPFTFERFKEALCQYLKRKADFDACQLLDQKMIDEVIRVKSVNKKPKSIQREKLEKGLNEQTYKQILHAVKQTDQWFTAEEMAEKLGMARVTVRRYLEFLYGEEKLERLQEYGKIGRPQHKYRGKM